MRDVSCVTCRACDVARDRSIGRESGEGSVSGGVEEIWPKFLLLLLLLLLLLCHFRLLSKMLHEEIRQLRFTKYFFFYFRQRAEFAHGGPKSEPFSYTCPNYQFFLGKSPAFFKISKNRVRSRTRVQSVVSNRVQNRRVRRFIKRARLGTVGRYIEICHTSNEILRFS